MVYVIWIWGSKIEVWRLQNRGPEAPKLKSWGVMGASWGAWGVLGLPERPRRGPKRRPGGVLGPSWGRFWAVFGGQEAVFGASWGHLEAIWGNFRASWRFKWMQHVAFHLACRFFDRFWMDLASKVPWKIIEFYLENNANLCMFKGWFNFNFSPVPLVSLVSLVGTVPLVLPPPSPIDLLISLFAGQIGFDWSWLVLVVLIDFVSCWFVLIGFDHFDWRWLVLMGFNWF